MHPSSRRSVGGRPELGQNFLVDRRVVARIAALVPPGPVVELGAGDGALTRQLAVRADPVTAVELDPARVAGLRRTLGVRVRVVHDDMLRIRPDVPNVVSNVPFGITTPVLRHLLRQRAWTTAVLLLHGRSPASARPSAAPHCSPRAGGPGTSSSSPAGCRRRRSGRGRASTAASS